MRSGANEGNEAVCFQSLCRTVLASGIDSVLDSCNLQKIGDALRLLRGGDHTVAPKTCGWVTTIDSVLCVLVFRDPHAFLRRFVGELHIQLNKRMFCRSAYKGYKFRPRARLYRS